MVCFLHTADLHLGLRITRFPPEIIKKVREHRMAALDNILHVAKDRRVDFLLVAGDLFDDDGIDPNTIRRTFEILEAAPMQVLVLPGNHDPLLPGGIWDRPPWNHDIPGRIRVLREAQPIVLDDGVSLFPCPVFRKTCLNDPTEWIRQAPATTDTRIGTAHGSLRTREDLPLDDHLIARHATSELRLDYLALGHWHRRQLFADPEGVERTAYPGVHEPMGFQGTAENRTGWADYSGDLDLFRDAGTGEVLLVRLRSPKDPPEIEAVQVASTIWEEQNRELRAMQDLERLIGEIARKPEPDRRLLRLRLTGVLDAEGMLKVEDLREILSGRYLWGELDDEGLHVEPTEEQIGSLAGHGVLQRVLDKLHGDMALADPPTARIAERSLLLLYQIAREAET